MDNKTLFLGILVMLLAAMLLYDQCNPNPITPVPVKQESYMCFDSLKTSSCADSLKNIDNSISEVEAQNLINNYVAKKEGLLNGLLKDTIGTLPNGEVFGRDQILKALSGDSCIGLKLFYGLTDDYQLKLILVPQNFNCVLDWARALEHGQNTP